MVIGQRYRRALLRKGNAGGVRAAVFGQRCAVLLPGAAGHDGRVDGQRSEQALGFPGVAEGQCSLRVVGQQARLGGHGLGPLGLQQMPLLGIDQPENEADDDQQEEEGERNKLVADVRLGVRRVIREGSIGFQRSMTRARRSNCALNSKPLLRALPRLMTIPTRSPSSGSSIMPPSWAKPGMSDTVTRRRLSARVSQEPRFSASLRGMNRNWQLLRSPGGGRVSKVAVLCSIWPRALPKWFLPNHAQGERRGGLVVSRPVHELG